MQISANKHLKALICQLKPQLKQKNANLKRVGISLQHYSADDKLDIIMFPQMSFTGYNFKDHQDALSVACEYGTGEEYNFCCKEAIRLNAYVIVGYVQKCMSNNKCILYNSVMILDRKGIVIKNVRKCHLFYNDKLWCQQGDSFKSIRLTNINGDQFDCGICICMDINAKDFTSGEFEFADFMNENNLQVILFITNWVQHQENHNQKQSILSIYNYWMHRMTPLLVHGKSENNKPLLFIAADRVGQQYSYHTSKNIKFFGASCAIKLNPSYIIKNLGKSQQGYLLIETSLPK